MSEDMLGAAVRLAISLPLVAALAYYAIKYGLAKRPFISSGSRRMRLVEQLPIGPRSFLSLVEAGGKYYLISHDDKSVSLLKEFEEMPEPLPVAENSPASFNSLLQRWTGGKHGQSNPARRNGT